MTNSKGRRTNFRKRLAIRRTLEDKDIMNRNYRNNDRRDGSQIVAIVNEEFAKNATPEVTKAAILARLSDRCDGEEFSFPNQAAKDAAINADALNPVSAQHTADLASALVTG